MLVLTKQLPVGLRAGGGGMKAALSLGSNHATVH